MLGAPPIEKALLKQAFQNKIVKGLSKELSENTVEGKDIHITDSAEAPASIFPIANTEQKQYSGKNLIDINQFKELSATSEIINMTESSITANFISQYGGLGKSSIPLSAKKYIVSLNIFPLDASAGLELRFYKDKEQVGTAIIVRTNYIIENVDNKYDYVELILSNRTYIGEVTFSNIQLEEGESVTSHEPYVGGQPSPSPNYPQEIKYINGTEEKPARFDIKKVNKNLLPYASDVEKIINGITLRQSKGKFIINGTANDNTIITLNLENPYTIQDKDYLHLKNTSVNMNCAFNFLDNSYEVADISTSLSAVDRIIDLNSLIGFKIYKVSFYCNTGASFNNFEFSPMILNNINTATEFIEHEEETYKLDIPHKLAKLGDTTDEYQIAYEEDEYGYKKIIEVNHMEKTGIVELDGSDDENWQFYISDNRFYISISNIKKNLDDSITPTMLCNKLITVSKNKQDKFDNSISIQNNSNLIIIRINSFISTVEELRVCLAENPLKVLYELETPITTPVTDKVFLKQLEDLLNTFTYKGETNISVSSSNEESALPILNVTYKQSNQIKLEKMQEEIDNLKALVLES